MIRAVRTMFKCHVILFVGETLDAVKAYIKKGDYELNFPDEFYERVTWVRTRKCDGVTGFGTLGTCFIYVRSLKHIPSIFHEIEHATSHILWRAGVPHNDSTDEVFAYLQEYIMDGFLDPANTKKE